jgi:hypothetical protein
MFLFFSFMRLRRTVKSEAVRGFLPGGVISGWSMNVVSCELVVRSFRQCGRWNS